MKASRLVLGFGLVVAVLLGIAAAFPAPGRASEGGERKDPNQSKAKPGTTSDPDDLSGWWAWGWAFGAAADALDGGSWTAKEKEQGAKVAAESSELGLKVLKFFFGLV